LPLNKLIKKGYYSYKCIREAKKMIRDLKIDVLFLYNIPQLPLMYIQGCIKVFDFADDYTAMLKQELGAMSNPLLMGIGQAMLDKMVKNSDITLAVSHVLARSIEAKEHKKVFVVPNGVSLDTGAQGSGEDIRRGLKPPVIGFIGSFEYFIDFELILEAAKRLPELTFLMVGSGRDFNKVKEKVELGRLNNVVLTGGVAHSQIFRYIDAMDICLNIFKPISISHGACPIKLFEYLSMKKPVISTRLHELNNIDKGFIFYADTADELVETVKSMLSTKKNVAEFIEKGYNEVRENYLWPDIAKRLLNIIKQII
jgi:glycosyltransferase involved in cell wall biosynthesis